MYVCVYVCMYICVCMYVRKYVLCTMKYMHAYIFMPVHMYVCTHLLTYRSMNSDSPHATVSTAGNVTYSAPAAWRHTMNVPKVASETRLCGTQAVHRSPIFSLVKESNVSFVLGYDAASMGDTVFFRNVGYRLHVPEVRSVQPHRLEEPVKTSKEIFTSLVMCRFKRIYCAVS